MDVRALLMGLAFAAIWSSAFTSARIIVADAPPLYALSLRFFLSGIIALGWAVLARQSFRLTPLQWRATILFGICQNALYLGLNFVAMQTIEASIAAIIASILPLLVALAGWTFRGERQSPLGMLGLVGGFAGVLIIMLARVSGGIDGMGLLLCFAGVLALTLATLALRNAASGENLLVVVGWQMLVGAGALLPVAMLTESFEVTPSWPLGIAFAYTTLMPGLVATLLWFLLVRRVGPVEAAVFHFLNPFFGVAIAALLLGERLSMFDYAGVTLIGVAILIVQRDRTKRSGN